MSAVASEPADRMSHAHRARPNRSTDPISPTGPTDPTGSTSSTDSTRATDRTGPVGLTRLTPLPTDLPIDHDQPLSLAEAVWQAALGLPHAGRDSADHEVTDAAGGATVTLVRLAHHDVTVLRHASAIGRGRRHRGRSPGTVDRAVARLDAAIALLSPADD